MANASKKRPATFREAVVNDENKMNKMRYGENGCPEFTDTGSDVLNLSQLVRGNDPKCDSILQSGNVCDVVDAITLCFLTRNVRGGKGEKDLAFKMFVSIWKHFPRTARKLLSLFAHFGYWKDLLLIAEMCRTSKDQGIKNLHESVMEEAIQLMRTQFQKDLAVVEAYEKEQHKGSAPTISLLAKWLPRENSHFDKRLNFCLQFLQEDETDGWNSSPQKVYRRQVSKLTSYLSLPEVYLSAKRADEIQFSNIASKATFKLSRALLNEKQDGEIRSSDPKRIKCADLFIQHMLEKGLKGKTLMPDEIVAEILKGEVSPLRAKVLDAQWKDLWKGVVDQVKQRAQEDGLDFDPSKMVPLSDVSGSMYGKPMEVSMAMGIGISEITHPAFQNMVLTFESLPKWHMLNAGDSIVQKVQSLSRAPWGGITNFEAAYDKILEVCIKHKLAKEDVPSLIVISDMQFNQANCSSSSKSLPMYEVLRGKFASVAHKLHWKDVEPTPIVYWNARNMGGHPVEQGTVGAVLLSGFSPNMLKMVMNGEALQDQLVEIVEADGTVRTEIVRVTPSQVLRKALDESLYDPVRQILLASNERILREYNRAHPVLRHGKCI
mmetsp:Transcript_9964/g.20752  ORF Transcript_9964/g.20752 Transcript_9964/m.20752 type:complete len:605 (+) Transcript_9964:96-1910(+)